jgi:hypothetical protein
MITHHRATQDVQHFQHAPHSLQDRNQASSDELLAVWRSLINIVDTWGGGGSVAVIRLLAGEANKNGSKEKDEQFKYPEGDDGICDGTSAQKRLITAK